MSAPTPAPGDAGPRAGYYPDPSIPGYIRYWNGAAWVPGTSRPAPGDGEPMPEPPASAVPAPVVFPAPAPAPVPAPTRVAPVDETGPVFFDEQDGPLGDELHGVRPEPATAWQADTSRQAGFGGEHDRRVSWGSEPHVAPPREERDPAGAGTREREAAAGQAVRDGQPARAAGAPVPEPAHASSPSSPSFALPPEHSGSTATSRGAGTLSFGTRTAARTPRPATAPAGTPAAGGIPGPVTTGTGGGSASWAQQVHRLAGPQPSSAPTEQPRPAEVRPSRPAPESARGPQADEAPAAPWKPVAQDPFLAAAQAQAASRPAGLGRRFAARVIDTAVLGAVTGAASVPLVTTALDHVRAKIDAAELSGETRTVWLLDGTTAGCLGAVLGLLLVLGILYEAVPTGRWGRTLGKKLCGVRVCGIESYEPPGFGAALRRWSVYCLLGVVFVGVLNVLWCLFDRPWRQCWHDKAARTFVAG